jgi:hypothetical protein
VHQLVGGLEHHLEGALRPVLGLGRRGGWRPGSAAAALQCFNLIGSFPGHPLVGWMDGPLPYSGSFVRTEHLLGSCSANTSRFRNDLGI